MVRVHGTNTDTGRENGPTNHPPVFDTAGMDELAGSSQLVRWS
jgi:hypothetical protein